MLASIWDRIDAQAIKRGMSRAHIIEAACEEYADKLDRIDKEIERESRHG